MPTAEAKERAWQRAVHDDELPNAVNEAIISGFSHPAQRALLTPYVERYFADVADVWERRTSERAQPVVMGLFPAWAVDKATVDAADAWLADDDAPAGPAPAGVGGPGRDRPGPGRPGVRPVVGGRVAPRRAPSHTWLAVTHLAGLPHPPGRL